MASTSRKSAALGETCGRKNSFPRISPRRQGKYRDHQRRFRHQRRETTRKRRRTITTEQRERMSDRESANLFFHPDLSSAEHISNVSGRGLGMDAVKNKHCENRRN